MPEQTPLAGSSFGNPDNGRTVTVEFKGLKEATQQQAISVAAWLRNIALEIEDPTFRAKVDTIFTYGYCQPLNVE